MRVASLHIYPLKGARAIDLDRSDLLAGGLRNDRRFMLADADSAHVTQRRHPRLSLVETAIEGDALVLRAPSGRVVVPLEPDGPRTRVRIWKDEVEATIVSAEASALLSEHLEAKCTLVFMPGDVVRQVDTAYARASDRVGFADGYPVLVASLASLADLNAHLEAAGQAPVPMNRFRPNVVIAGGEPFAEDRAALARIGAVAFRLPKRCSRCEITGVDQATGVRGKEPLRTLASYRTEGNKVHFAVNAIPDLEPDASASIAVGDPVTYEAAPPASA